MATLIKEENFINQNVLKYDDRFQSPIVRFIEQAPTFVTYYHINVNESTTDRGYNDVESIIGEKSPIRFQQINDFPIYGIDQIVTQLQDTETGLDVSYEGEGIILPNTIKPLQNDYFIIPYVGTNILFHIIGIEYDNIRPDNFYKIQFSLDVIDEEKKDTLLKQVHDEYTCILENIGSENKCIIQREFVDQLNKIDKLYSDMVSLYMSIFYNERYNVLLGEMAGGYLLYDPYMISFINEHQLFTKKNDLDTIYLEGEQVVDNKFKLKYERSIYRFFERRSVDLIKPFYYTTIQGITRHESAFYRWGDESVYIVDIPSQFGSENTFRILPDITIDTIKLNGPTDSKYLKLIQRFIRNEQPLNIYDIDLTLNDELIKLDANLEMFFITPLLLYIIKKSIEEFNRTGISDKPV